METFLVKALQLILSLSILVLVHEFGHFIFARIFKVRVEKFYLFFDPWFSIFKFKPKNSDTEYGVGNLPGVRRVSATEGYMEVEIGSGSYHFGK